MSFQPIPDKTQVRSELIGTHLQRYELLEKIGDGANGAVYRAKHADTGQEAAIKVTREAVSEREVRAATYLKHPGVAEVYGLGRLPDGRHYVIMELMHGEGLDWALHRTGTMLVPEAVKVLLAVTEALEVAHRRSVPHGNLKPSSVFLVKKSDDSTQVKLLDFGIASSGAPEPSVENDLQALGVLGFKMLTGRKDVPTPLPRPIAPVLPLVLEELIADLIEAASKLRPKTATEVRAKLEPLRPLPPPVPPELAKTMVPTKVVPPPVPKRSSRAWVLPAALALALLVVAGGVWLFVNPHSSEPEMPVVATPPPEPVVEPRVLEAAPVLEGPNDAKPSLPRSPRQPKVVPVPTEEALEARIDRLEEKLKKLPGDRGDAQHQLNKLKLKLTGSPDEAERREVRRLLDAWEHTHLSRGHWN
ncbi:MAG: serine/threonine protein kinase [Myxococcaceae bacterium]|nr:serine/threonine protein kinase [Myxococcaceae bacterium]